MSAPSGYSLADEIAALRTLLRRMGSETPEERETVEAEIKGTTLLVRTIAQCVRIDNEMHPADDAGHLTGLQGMIGRALDRLGKGGDGAGNA